MRDMINTPTLRALAEAGSIRSAQIVGVTGGFALVVKYGLIERKLEAKRGHLRLFRSLDTAAPYLRSLGITSFTVDTANWESDRRAAA